MGCGLSREGKGGLASGRAGGKLSDQNVMRQAAVTVAATEPKEDDFVALCVAGYTTDYPQKGTVATCEDYKGYDVTTTNHVSKAKVDRLCKWADQALQDRAKLNNDVFFNPQNPISWPKEILNTHLSSPSFADRHTPHESYR